MTVNKDIRLKEWHGFCVRTIDCECDNCIRSDATSPGSVGCCVRSISCECDICIESDTFPENDGLNCDEMETDQPSHFQVHDDPQVELDSLVLGCTRELDLSSLCFSTWLKCVEIKTTRIASYLFDKMSEGDHVQVVHAFIRIKSKFSLVLVGNGLVVPVWDPGIGLKTVKLVGHTNNVKELLMDITNMFCLHTSSDSINRVWVTGWKWFMHPPVVHINPICSVATIPTYIHDYSGIGCLSLHVTTSSRKEIMLLWGSTLQLTLYDDSKKVATIDLAVHNWSVDRCTTWKAYQRRGSVIARSLSTTRAKVSLEELHVYKRCQPWLFDFILLVAMYFGALNFCSRLEDGKAIWLQITRRELLVNWSTKTEVKLGTFSLSTFWKVEFARSLITTSRVVVVGLHIVLSKPNGSTKKNDHTIMNFDPDGTAFDASSFSYKDPIKFRFMLLYVGAQNQSLCCVTTREFELSCQLKRLTGSNITAIYEGVRKCILVVKLLKQNVKCASSDVRIIFSTCSELGQHIFLAHLLKQVTNTFQQLIMTTGKHSYGGKADTGGKKEQVLGVNTSVVPKVDVEFWREHKKDLIRNPRALGRSRIACERAKRTLFSTAQTTTEVDSLFKGIKFYATITQARFEELCMSMLLKSMEHVWKCLSDAKIDNIQIQEVVLVSRSTRFPIIQQLLKDCLDVKKPYTSINLDDDTSYGAAVLDAIMFEKRDEKVQELLVVDVIRLDLGFETVGGMIIVLISRNATISTKEGQIFPTYSDHQLENAPIEELIRLNFCKWHWLFCGCSIQPVTQARFSRYQIERPVVCGAI